MIALLYKLIRLFDRRPGKHYYQVDPAGEVKIQKKNVSW